MAPRALLQCVSELWPVSFRKTAATAARRGVGGLLNAVTPALGETFHLSVRGLATLRGVPGLVRSCSQDLLRPVSHREPRTRVRSAPYILCSQVSQFAALCSLLMRTLQMPRLCIRRGFSNFKWP